MRLLVDTHTLIWLHDSPSKIPARASAALKSANNTVYVSAGSAWEIAVKSRQGRLTFDPSFTDDFDTRVRAIGYEPLPILAAHAVAGANLPGRHKDPFDRLLAGQAQVEGLTVVTGDPLIAGFGVPMLWR